MEIGYYGIIGEIERIKSNVISDGDIEKLEKVSESAYSSDVEVVFIIVPKSSAKNYSVADLPMRYADSAMFSQGYYIDSVVEDIPHHFGSGGPH